METWLRSVGCQFRCDEELTSGFSFGSVSSLLKNRFQFWFCLRKPSVLGFQFRFMIQPKKCFALIIDYYEIKLKREKSFGAYFMAIWLSYNDF